MQIQNIKMHANSSKMFKITWKICLKLEFKLNKHVIVGNSGSWGLQGITLLVIYIIHRNIETMLNPMNAQQRFQSPTDVHLLNFSDKFHACL